MNGYTLGEPIDCYNSTTTEPFGGLVLPSMGGGDSVLALSVTDTSTATGRHNAAAVALDRESVVKLMAQLGQALSNM